MLGEKREVVRRIYDAASCRDSATVLRLYDPDVTLCSTRLDVVGEAGAVRRGQEALEAAGAEA